MTAFHYQRACFWQQQNGSTLPFLSQIQRGVEQRNQAEAYHHWFWDFPVRCQVVPANELHETCIGQWNPYRCSSLGGTASSSIQHSYSWAENISNIAIYFHRWKWSRNTDKQPLSYVWLTELCEPAKYLQPATTSCKSCEHDISCGCIIMIFCWQSNCTSLTRIMTRWRANVKWQDSCNGVGRINIHPEMLIAWIPSNAVIALIHDQPFSWSLL